MNPEVRVMLVTKVPAERRVRLCLGSSGEERRLLHAAHCPGSPHYSTQLLNLGSWCDVTSNVVVLSCSKGRIHLSGCRAFGVSRITEIMQDGKPQHGRLGFAERRKVK